MKWKACIFDLDGTLLYTLDDLAIAANHALTRFSLPTHTLAEYNELVGEGIQRLIEKMLPAPQRDDPAFVSQVKAVFDNYYEQHYLDNSYPYDGVIDAVRAIAAKGAQCAVLSNKTHEFTVDIIRTFFTQQEIPVVFGKREGVEKKPDPAAVFDIFRLLNVTAEETVFVGDSQVDMETAVASGCYPVGVSWGYRSVDEIIASGAKHMAYRPDELPELFGGTL